MTFNNLPTVVLGLALIASLGGCCTSGSCGSASCSSANEVYSAPTAAPTPAADCGCGCSVASDSGMSYTSTEPQGSSQFYSPSEISSSTPYVSGDVTSSVSTPTPVVEAPSLGETSGFTAGSSSKLNELPGNLLPGK